MSDPAKDVPWPERRFSQAVAEGDGISIIPIIRGDAEVLVAAAERAGAEAVLVESIADAQRARASTQLPVVVRPIEATPDVLEAARAVGADAVALRASALGNQGESAYAQAVALGLDCALCVKDEEELHAVLEAFEPEIVVAAPDRHDGEEALASTLTLLTDVPAGKLVIVEPLSSTRDDVVSFENAGVDALVIDAPGEAEQLSAMLNWLIGAEHPLN